MAAEEIAGAAEGGPESITGSKTMVGALPYMSPEMIETPRDADTPADIWALAAMMYELLSGKKPFGAGLKAVPAILSGEVPPKPRQIDSKVQFKPLGDELFKIISGCLRKDPGDRPSADDLVKQCEQLCYPVAERHVGVVDTINYSSWGFIKDESGSQAFFHLESAYGTKVEVGSQVCFSKFPGTPRCRAHPVLVIRDKE